MSQPKLASDRTRNAGRLPDTRERILRDAAALFRERGFHGTSVRDIAARVGVLSGSLFHHFESKESILAAIAREAALSLCLGAEAAVDGIPDPVARLRELVRFQLDAFTSGRRDFYAVLTSEWRHVPAPDQGELRALRRRYFAFSRRIIDACDAIGRIRVPADAAHRIVNSVTVDATTWFRQEGRYGIEQFAGIVASLVLKDGPPPPRGAESRTGR